MTKKWYIIVSDRQQIDIALTAFISTGVIALVILALSYANGLEVLEPIRNYWHGLFDRFLAFARP